MKLPLISGLKAKSDIKHFLTTSIQIFHSRGSRNSLKMFKKWLAVVARPLCPDLRRDHGLLRSNRRHEVLLGQEVQGKLDQEASDFAQLLLSAGQVSLSQTWFGLVLFQLGHVPHQG